MEKTDEQLMREFVAGDPGGFDVLLERYRRPVFSIILSMGRDREIVEDVFQEIFLKVIKKAETFDGERRFASWLFKIVDNTCIDVMRRDKTARRWNAGGEEALNRLAVSPEANPDAELVAKERRELLWETLAVLPDVQRSVILLREFAGYSYDEISGILSRPLNTVFSDMHRGLKRLRETWPGGQIHVEVE
ncbi:MAG TPA: sigma-70 family RNA polymerase sigma factor [bacterium]|nr:sigma-70 family RNA polymerase sigma factor [bacterium]